MAKRYDLQTRSGVISFESDLSYDEAYEILKKDKASKPYNEFRDSLVKRYGGDGMMSAKQLGWMIKLAQDSVDEEKMAAAVAAASPPQTSSAVVVAGRPPAPVPTSGLPGGSLAMIHKPFQAAGLKRFMMRFGDVKITQAPASGSNPNHLYVYKGGQYVGKITPAGRYEGPPVPGLLAKLQEVAINPYEAAIKHGRETGNCSCCGAKLTDPVSVSIGIGPVCLERMAGKGSRKEAKAAIKSGQVNTFVKILLQMQKIEDAAQGGGANGASQPSLGSSVDRRDYPDDSSYMIAKSIGGIR